MKQYFATPEIATQYDQTWAELNLFHTDTRVLDSLFTTPCALLDLGCGTGRHVVHFARKKFSVTGVDLSEHMLETARQKIAAGRLIARLIHGDILDLGALPDGFFGGACCMFSTLGMLPNRSARAEVLSRARAKLKPGGLFVFHMHNKFHHGKSLYGALWLAANFLNSLSGQCEFGDRVMKNYRGIPDFPLHLSSVWEARALLKETGYADAGVFPLTRQRDAVAGGFWAELTCNGFVIAGRNP